MPGRGHDIWVDAANEPGLLDWLFSQKRTDTVTPLNKTLDETQLAPGYQGGADTSVSSPTTNVPATDTEADDRSTDTASVTDTAPDKGTKDGIPTAAIAVALAAGVAAVIGIVLKKKKK